MADKNPPVDSPKPTGDTFRRDGSGTQPSNTLAALKATKPPQDTPAPDKQKP